MNTTTKTTMEITLKLTTEEAIWLKIMVQNPPPSPHYESAETAGMRAALFNALPSFSDLYQENSQADRPL